MATAEATTTTKTKRIKVKHPKRKLFRASEPLLSVFMWGVNHTVRELQHVAAPVMLMPDDFRSFSKIKVNNQAFNQENLPSHFKVKEYCPQVFRNLRERFGIDDGSFLKSLTQCPKKSGPSSGRSAAKCYLSHDKMYVIKSLTSEEVEQMHFLLKQYHPYVVERHGKTLLPQYLGMYRLTVDNIEHYVVVTRNIFSRSLKIHKKYGLKGSTVDREASQKEREKDHPTFKDNDFLNDGVKIHIGEEAKAKLLETLTADVEFLTKLHTMDYSLLLGVHDCEAADQEQSADPEETEPAEEDYDSGASGGVALTPPDSPAVTNRGENFNFEGGARGIDPERDIYAIASRAGGQHKREVYFLGLVDILTHYGVKKQAAKVAKTVKYGSSVDGISTAEPEQYASRFLEFMANAIE